MAIRVLGLLILTMAVFALLGVQTTILTDGDLGPTLRTTAHVPLWALLSFLWLVVSQSTRIKARWVLATLVLFAVLTEVIEARIFNGLSAADLTENLTGVALGALGWALLPSAGDIGRRKALILVSMTIIVSAAVIAPIAVSIYKHLDRQSWFPVLFDPAMSNAAQMILSSSDPESVSINWTPTGLEIGLAPGRRSWVAIVRFIADWTGSSTLRIELENLSEQALNFRMSLRDRPGATPMNEQFHYAGLLAPLAQDQIRIPLQAIQNAENRRMDLEHVSVITFSSGDTAQRFKLHAIALE